jgi:hypothetical protein
MLSALLMLALAAAPEGGTVMVGVGEQVVLTIPGIQRIASTSCFDVKTIGNNQVLIIGGSAGCKNTLLVWKSNGERVSFLLIGVKGKPVPKVTDGMSLQVEVGKTLVLDLPGVERFKPSCPGDHWLSFDQNVVEISARGVCTGKHGLLKKDGTTLTVNVESVPAPARDGG